MRNISIEEVNTMIGIGFKQIVMIVGIVMSLVGILTDNWKVATVGNSIALTGVLFL